MGAFGATISVTALCIMWIWMFRVTLILTLLLWMVAIPFRRLFRAMIRLFPPSVEITVPRPVNPCRRGCRTRKHTTVKISSSGTNRVNVVVLFVVGVLVVRVKVGEMNTGDFLYGSWVVVVVKGFVVDRGVIQLWVVAPLRKFCVVVGYGRVRCGLCVGGDGWYCVELASLVVVCV